MSEPTIYTISVISALIVGIALGVYAEYRHLYQLPRDMIVLIPREGDETDRLQAAFDFTAKYGGVIESTPGTFEISRSLVITNER